MWAVVPPVSTWPAPGVASPLDGAVVAVPPDAAAVVGVAATVVAVRAAVVGVADVEGVEAPPTGGWVSGTVVDGIVDLVVLVLPPAVEGAVPLVVGVAVVVLVVPSPLRTTAVAMPAPRRPITKTASATARSRLRSLPPGISGGPLPHRRLCRAGQPQTWTLRWRDHAGVAQR